MVSPLHLTFTAATAILLATRSATEAFQTPHHGHHHPLYTRYQLEQLERRHNDQQQHQSSTEQRGTAFAMSESGPTCSIDYGLCPQQRKVFVVALDDADVSISTPIEYDDQTGMVQTAVRAIVRHPIKDLVDNSVVGLSSTFVVTAGALTEVVHNVGLEISHHATDSTEGLAILSFGHFLHYGREGIKQLVEYHEKTEQQQDDETTTTTASAANVQ